MNTSKPPPRSTNSPRRFTSDAPEVLNVRQHDGLGLLQVRQARAADEIDRSRIERRFCIALARRREPQCGLEEVGLRLIRGPARVPVHEQHTRGRRDLKGQEAAVVER